MLSSPVMPITPNPFKHASIFFGVFFCLLISACGEKKSTPDWSNEVKPEDVSDISRQKTTPSAYQKKSHSHTKRSDQTTPTSSHEVRFLAYNLRNYLTMRRYINGKAIEQSKPDAEISKLIEIIHRAHPDILGVCEIGRDNDLLDLQSRLKKSGLNLPHTYRTYGSDTVRSLAILSRYPITSKKRV